MPVGYLQRDAVCNSNMATTLLTRLESMATGVAPIEI